MALREILAAFGVEFDDKELKKGDKAVDGFKSKLTKLAIAAAGAFSVKAVVDFTSEVLREADATAKAASGLGLLGAELQGIEHAAGLSGVQTELLRVSLAKLSKGAADAAGKGGPAGDAFKKLGIEFKNQDGTIRSSVDLLEEVADAVSSLNDPTQAASELSALFGEQFTKLTPLLKAGRVGIAAMRAEVNDLGFAYDEAFLEDAQAVNDNFDRLKKGIRGFGIQAIAAVLPYVRSFSKAAVTATKRVVKWTRETSLLRAGLLLLTAGALGKLIGIAGKLGPKVLGLIAKFGGFRKILLAIARVAARFLLPLLALDDVITFLRGGKSVLGEFLDKLFGVGTAQRVVEELRDIWRNFSEVVLPEAAASVREIRDTIKSAIGDALGWVDARFQEFLAAAHAVWEDLPGPLQDVLTGIQETFGAVFDWIGNKIEAALEKFFPLKALFNALDDDANADARARRDAADATPPPPRAPGGRGRPRTRSPRGGPAAGPGVVPLPAFLTAGSAVASAPVVAAQTTSVTNNIAPKVTNHLMLPPGTSEQTVRRAGEAVTRGVSQGIDLAAAEAAVVRTAG